MKRLEVRRFSKSNTEFISGFFKLTIMLQKCSDFKELPAEAKADLLDRLLSLMDAMLRAPLKIMEIQYHTFDSFAL